MLEQISIWIVAGMLVATRVGAALVLLPAPFGALAPMSIRAALSLWLAWVLLGLNQGAPLPNFDLPPAELGLIALGEVALGAVMGLTVRVTLAAAEVAGNVAGFAIGLGFAATADPTTGEEALPPARLLNALAILIFFALQGHHQVLRALSFSLVHAPPGQVWPVLMQEGLVDMGAQVTARGLRIASPVVATMFLIQLGSGLVARAAPRVQLFVLSFGVATAAGLAVFVLVMPQMAFALAGEMRLLGTLLSRLLGG